MLWNFDELECLENVKTHLTDGLHDANICYKLFPSGDWVDGTRDTHVHPYLDDHRHEAFQVLSPMEYKRGNFTTKPGLTQGKKLTLCFKDHYSIYRWFFVKCI